MKKMGTCPERPQMPPRAPNWGRSGAPKGQTQNLGKNVPPMFAAFTIQILQDIQGAPSPPILAPIFTIINWGQKLGFSQQISEKLNQLLTFNPPL